MKPQDNHPLKFSSIHISKMDNSIISFHQTTYISKLEELEINASFDGFFLMTNRLAWISSTRLDTIAPASRFSQVTESIFLMDHVKKFKFIIENLKLTATQNVKHRPLDINEEKIVVLSYCCYATNHDS